MDPAVFKAKNCPKTPVQLIGLIEKDVQNIHSTSK
jgi:hypothetical protein